MAWADFDVNAIAGRVLLDGEAAPSGTMINITNEDKGISVLAAVDGPNLPPFVWGMGRYDTGDIPQFDSGDTVAIGGIHGQLGTASATLVGGTTMVNLSLTTVRPSEEVEGSEPDSETELHALTVENLALRAENAELRARLDECESGLVPFDYLAALDGPNLSGGSEGGMAQALLYLVEEACWGADCAARTVGTRTVSVLDEVEKVSDSIWDVSGSILDSFLGFIPALMDGRMLAIMVAVMVVGFSLTIFVVGRDSRRRFRQRLDAMRQEGVVSSERPFWDETEV